MECQPSDSKKLFKVFDASKRKRTRKKRDGLDDTNSVATDESSGCQANACRIMSGKASLQDMPTLQKMDGLDANSTKRDSSASMCRSPDNIHRSSRSPRRHRRPPREGISLALKAGLMSTPRSISPPQEGDAETMPKDQDSMIYTYLEEAIKRDKKKQRHARRQDERRVSRDRDHDRDRDRDRVRDRDRDVSREHRHHHHRRRRDDVPSREHEKRPKEESPAPKIDQSVLFETFAKLCAQMNEKTLQCPASPSPAQRTQSHKSLQCEVISKRDKYDHNRPEQLRGLDRTRENLTPSKIRSQENFNDRCRSYNKIAIANDERRGKDCGYCYEKDFPKYSSKLDVARSRIHNIEEDRYREYPADAVPTRSCIDHYRGHLPDVDRGREYRDDRIIRGRNYEEDKRRYFEETSRSFEVHNRLPDDERCRRTVRSDTNKEKRYGDYRERYEEKPVKRERPSKEQRSRRNMERFDRTSIASRDEDYREKDRYSERERDSGLSVADGETSVVSGRSNYLRVVKQEIAEQREAMDKMMKLWKELMRCFKGISQTQVQDKNVNESAENVRESAAAQLRLWRECMRRYETVARDVGDTDARLMEEINKQRSEMAEMAGMWQECLQRYRDMSNDFNSLKQKLSTPESPTRPAAAPLVCAEGEPAPYRLPHNYPPMPPVGVGYGGGGSPLRGRASAPAPPAWWWGAGPGGGPGPRDSPRRRSSPDSRGSRDRERRHRHKDRDESRYKDKSSKPSAARSEHRHRKR